MPHRRRSALALIGMLLLAYAGSADAIERRFEHVMTIGAGGAGEGQFTYLEDFAFSTTGSFLATDAEHAYVQVSNKPNGSFLGRFGGKGDGDGSGPT